MPPRQRQEHDRVGQRPQCSAAHVVPGDRRGQGVGPSPGARLASPSFGPRASQALAVGRRLRG
jgi:hypothetical protein